MKIIKEGTLLQRYKPIKNLKDLIDKVFYQDKSPVHSKDNPYLFYLNCENCGTEFEASPADKAYVYEPFRPYKYFSMYLKLKVNCPICNKTIKVWVDKTNYRWTVIDPRNLINEAPLVYTKDEMIYDKTN